VTTLHKKAIKQKKAKRTTKTQQSLMSQNNKKRVTQTTKQKISEKEDPL
jgi:hypothetical protein